MKQQTFVLSLFLAATLFMSLGCTSDNPVNTGFTDQGGYSLNLGAPSGSLAYGGKMVLTGIIRDQNGQPVSFSTLPVIFTSEAGGEFAPWQAQIASGQVTTVYVAPKVVATTANIRAADAAAEVPEVPTTVSAPSSMPLVETISMTYSGATAKLRLTLYKP